MTQYTPLSSRFPSVHKDVVDAIVLSYQQPENVRPSMSELGKVFGVSYTNVRRILAEHDLTQFGYYKTAKEAEMLQLLSNRGITNPNELREFLHDKKN